ncbi:T9SS type A sorting domain-containing protein [Gilvibacter sediminis]|uniref:T9SS type A sorting domain-containing protein n=1 Tax=Gilvibacter sediminis TaxID=379071 RepID=UPI00235007DA|nr:T9SS type A sorting domain-containing protein [Gilvibacter sediminis]MDC7996525.1 T9SS type A sorting domain-containing protein [Gilvibacter sediminis]
MKLKLLFFLGLMGLSQMQAQDPILFEYDWYLLSTRVDGETYFPPSNSEVNFVPFYLNDTADPSDMLTYVCNALVADSVTYTDPYDITFNSLAMTLIDCTIPENGIFEFNYFNFFFQNEGVSLEYAIGIIDFPADDELWTLTIYNDDGDYVDYLSKILSVDDFTLDAVSLYPVPAKETLYVTNPKGLELSIEVYDVTGKRIQSGRFTNNSFQIDELAAGVYFATLSDGQATTVKRFIKQ